MLLFINYCIIFHNNCKPAFAEPCTCKPVNRKSSVLYSEGPRTMLKLCEIVSMDTIARGLLCEQKKSTPTGVLLSSFCACFSLSSVGESVHCQEQPALNKLPVAHCVLLRKWVFPSALKLMRYACS